LRHNRYNEIGLDVVQAKKVLRSLEFLWGYPVRIDSYETYKTADGWAERISASYDTSTYTFGLS
jgi:spore cortex formation protein SpoVR/YcgB (stage V sporulation)